MKNFILSGIQPPGKVNLPGYGTIELEKIDDDLAEKLFKEGLPYLQPTPQHRHKLQRHVPASLFAALAEAEQPGLVLLAGLAGRTIRPDAGLAHFGEGTFGQRPEPGQFLHKSSLLGREFDFAHDVCIVKLIHTIKEKTGNIRKIFQKLPLRPTPIPPPATPPRN